MLIGIIGAMDIEVQALKELMDDPKIETISTVDFYSGNINGTDVVVAVAGIGKVNAAVCAQTMILKYDPSYIINVGVAGGLSPELGIGDIAIAENVVEHDMDTTPVGDVPGYISGINVVRIPCDKWLSEMMCKASSHIDGAKVITGTIASGDQFISKDEERRKIIDNFDAIAAEMEGASIGHVCYMNSVPFGVLRAISDGANSDSVMDYPTFAKMAAKNSIKIICELLESIKEEASN
jgi:adenosylhomocysteine nucleosidase